MLRIYGDFDPAPIAARAGWKSDVRRKGEINRRGRPVERSCLQDSVRKCGFDNLPGQVADAIEFLTRESKAIADVTSAAAFEEGELEFGAAQRIHPAYSCEFPAQLVHLAGRAGLSICVSQYAVSGLGGFDDAE